MIVTSLSFSLKCIWELGHPVKINVMLLKLVVAWLLKSGWRIFYFTFHLFISFIFQFPPLRDCHLIVVRGFACLSDPKSYTSRSFSLQVGHPSWTGLSVEAWQSAIHFSRLRSGHTANNCREEHTKGSHRLGRTFRGADSAQHVRRMYADVWGVIVERTTAHKLPTFIIPVSYISHKPLRVHGLNCHKTFLQLRWHR